ncbi:hypothetical protein ACFQH2_11105 [Natronoarchaeum sp. GCM10025703]
MQSVAYGATNWMSGTSDRIVALTRSGAGSVTNGRSGGMADDREGLRW